MYEDFINNLITESAMQPIQEASFGIDTYEPPKDKEDMMMDFYYLSGIHTLLPDQLHGDLAKDLESASGFALNKIVDHVQKDLAEATFFAVCAEIRHIFDRNKYDEIIDFIKQNPTGTETVKIRTVKKDVDDFKVDVPWDVTPTKKFVKMFTEYANQMAGADRFGTTPSRNRLAKLGGSNIGKGSNSNYVQSYKAAIKASGGDKIAFAEMCKFLYIYADWATSYGGDAWAAIAHFYINVMNAKTLQDKIHTIDMLFSLQHNTGTVLNKVKKYSKAGSGYGWIAKALDFKFEVRNFAEYTKKVSPQLKQLAQAATKAINDAKEPEDIKFKGNGGNFKELEKSEINVDDTVALASDLKTIGTVVSKATKDKITVRWNNKKLNMTYYPREVVVRVPDKDKTKSKFKVGDDVQHKDLGYLREPIKILKVLKTVDKKAGQLYTVKNPETGKNFKAWDNELDEFDKIKLTGETKSIPKEEAKIGNAITVDGIDGTLKAINNDLKVDDKIIILKKSSSDEAGLVGIVANISAVSHTISVKWRDDDEESYGYATIEDIAGKFVPEDESVKDNILSVSIPTKEVNIPAEEAKIGNTVDIIGKEGKLEEIEGSRNLSKGDILVIVKAEPYYLNEKNGKVGVVIDKDDKMISMHWSHWEDDKSPKKDKVHTNALKDYAAKFVEDKKDTDDDGVIKPDTSKVEDIDKDKAVAGTKLEIGNIYGQLGDIRGSVEDGMLNVGDVIYGKKGNSHAGKVGYITKFQGTTPVVHYPNIENHSTVASLYSHLKKTALKFVPHGINQKQEEKLNDIPKDQAKPENSVTIGGKEGRLKIFKTSDLKKGDILVLDSDQDNGGAVVTYEGAEVPNDNIVKIHYPNFKGGTTSGIHPKELEDIFLKLEPEDSSKYDNSFETAEEGDWTSTKEKAKHGQLIEYKGEDYIIQSSKKPDFFKQHDLVVSGKLQGVLGKIVLKNELNNGDVEWRVDWTSGAKSTLNVDEIVTHFKLVKVDTEDELTRDDIIKDTNLGKKDIKDGEEVTIDGTKGIVKFKKNKDEIKKDDVVVMPVTGEIGKVVGFDDDGDPDILEGRDGQSSVYFHSDVLIFEPSTKSDKKLDDKVKGIAKENEEVTMDGVKGILKEYPLKKYKVGDVVVFKIGGFIGKVRKIDKGTQEIIVDWNDGQARRVPQGATELLTFEPNEPNHIADILSAFGGNKKDDGYDNTLTDKPNGKVMLDKGAQQGQTLEYEGVPSVIVEIEEPKKGDIVFGRHLNLMGTVVNIIDSNSGDEIVTVHWSGTNDKNAITSETFKKNYYKIVPTESKEKDNKSETKFHLGDRVQINRDELKDDMMDALQKDFGGLVKPEHYKEFIYDNKVGQIIKYAKSDTDVQNWKIAFTGNDGKVKYIFLSAAEMMKAEEEKEEKSIYGFKKGDKVKFVKGDEEEYMEILRGEGVDGDIDVYADFIYNGLTGTVKKIFTSSHDVVLTFESSASGEDMTIRLDPAVLEHVKEKQTEIPSELAYESEPVEIDGTWGILYSSDGMSEGEIVVLKEQGTIGKVVSIDNDKEIARVSWVFENHINEEGLYFDDLLWFRPRKNEELTEEAANTKAYVFDFDDTLAETKAMVKVKEDGQVMQTLTPQEFNTYKLKDGETFDFADFDNPKYVLSAKKYKAWRPLENVDRAITRGNSTSRIYILTARASVIKDALIKFFDKKGIKNIDPNDIYTVGDMQGGSIAAKKKLVLRAIKNNHKGKVTFFDDDKKNIELAKPEVDEVKLVSGLFESILDEPKENLDPLVWQSGDTPEIKPSVKKSIMKRLKKLMGKYPVYKVYVVGSITGKRWNEISDIDVTVIGDMTDEQQQEIVGQLKHHNEIDLEGTTHPVNFYTANKDLAFHRFDSVYDLLHDAWLKDPKDYGVDLSAYYDQFRSIMSGIAQDKSEAVRSVVDIDLLEKSIKLGGNATIIARKIMNRVGNLDAAISKLSETYGEIHKDRVDAFLRYESMTPEEKINIPSPNLLPENVRYKVLERYNYLDMLHKIYNFTKDSGKIDTPQEVREIKSILGLEDSISECINFIVESAAVIEDVTQTPEFKNWFGKSKVVDKNGRPLVVYHGTDKDFDTFSKKLFNTREALGDFAGEGFYFTSDKKLAAGYAWVSSRDENDVPQGTDKVMSVYLKMENPLVLKTEEDEKEFWKRFGGSHEKTEGTKRRKAIQQAGYDGVIVNDEEQQYIIFEPSHIKSVDNRGTFNPNSDNINEGDYSDEKFDANEIYNTYYATYLNQMYPDVDLDYEVDGLKKYYLKTFYDIVRTQIRKYEGRGRTTPDFNKDDIDSDNYDTLNNLMKKTFRTDMTRLNKRWIELTSHLAELAGTRGTEKILLKLDRINNTIHNTGEKMFTKFANARELLQAFEDAHTLAPKELKKKVTNRGLLKAARLFGESIDKGRDNFEKALKRWNDKAYGKVKSGKQPKDQNEDVDKMNKMNEEPTFEYTGGKRRKVNKSRDGLRQDSGAGNKGTKRRVSYREQMKRELGGVKSNIKTKMRGKQAAGDAKKIVGQILNPNSGKSEGRPKIIAESWYKAFKNHKNKTVDVFMNPAKKDLKREQEYDQVRGFIHGNNLFVWNAFKATHGEVADNIQTNQKEAIPVTLYITQDGSIGGIQVTDFSKRGNWFRNPKTKEAILKNKYIKLNVDKQSMQDEDFISYFDDAIVGAWDEIDEGKIGTANVLEALNVSSIPKDKRDEVLANKEASKKVGSEKIGKQQTARREAEDEAKKSGRVSSVNQAEWHKLSPQQKQKDLEAKNLIGGKAKELSKDGYNILIGDVAPDHFFNKPASQTFYYMRDNGQFILGGLVNHAELAKDDNTGKKLLVTALSREDIEWIIADHKKNHTDSMEMEISDIREPYGQDVHDIANSISASMRYPTPMDAYYGGRFGMTIDGVPSLSLWQEIEIDEAIKIAKDFTKKTGQKVINIYMPSSGYN